MINGWKLTPNSCLSWPDFLAQPLLIQIILSPWSSWKSIFRFAFNFNNRCVPLSASFITCRNSLLVKLHYSYFWREILCLTLKFTRCLPLLSSWNLASNKLIGVKFQMGCVMRKGPGQHDTWLRVICIWNHLLKMAAVIGWWVVHFYVTRTCAKWLCSMVKF